MAEDEDWSSRTGTRTKDPKEDTRPVERPAADTGPGASARQRPAVATVRGGRRARLVVRRFDPWSVLKFSFVLSIVLFVVWVVAISVLYGLLAGVGVFSHLNDTIGSFTSGQEPSLFSAKHIIGAAAVIGGLNIVLFTALSTLGAFIYNLSADLVGGVEVTLTERE